MFWSVVETGTKHKVFQVLPLLSIPHIYIYIYFLKAEYYTLVALLSFSFFSFNWIQRIALTIERLLYWFFFFKCSETFFFQLFCLSLFLVSSRQLSLLWSSPPHLVSWFYYKSELEGQVGKKKIGSI